ncbi:MAG: hypothetical protein ACTSRP_26975 [Candidatus Helarchaeota archaeon]
MLINIQNSGSVIFNYLIQFKDLRYDRAWSLLSPSLAFIIKELVII